jgi:hypothetical protein
MAIRLTRNTYTAGVSPLPSDISSARRSTTMLIRTPPLPAAVGRWMPCQRERRYANTNNSASSMTPLVGAEGDLLAASRGLKLFPEDAPLFLHSVGHGGRRRLKAPWSSLSDIWAALRKCADAMPRAARRRTRNPRDRTRSRGSVNDVYFGAGEKADRPATAADQDPAIQQKRRRVLGPANRHAGRGGELPRRRIVRFHAREAG